MRLFILVFLFVCIYLFSEIENNKNTKEVSVSNYKKTKTIIYGDIMEGFENGVRIVRGHLKAINGNTVVTGDWGKYYEKTQIVEVYGQVKVEDPSYTLKCGMIVIYFNEDHGIAKQNPVIIEKVAEVVKENGRKLPVKQKYIKLMAREINSYFDEDRIVARGNVRVDEIYFKQFLKPGMPVVASTITCNSLEMFLKENKSIGHGKVHLKSGDIEAYGEESVYYHDEEKLIITGNARAYQSIPNSKKRNKVEGDKIVYFVKSGRLVVLKARADVYPDNSEENKDKGKKH